MKRKVMGFLLAMMLVVSIFQGALADTPQKVNDVRNSVVRLLSEDGFIGTGICVAEQGKPVEYIITNAHVVTGENGKKQSTAYAVFDTLSAGSTTQATVVYYSETPDLAILRLALPTNKRVGAIFRSSETLKSGDTIYSIGFPGSADDLKKNQDLLSTPGEASLTSGLVSNPYYEMSTGVIAVQCDSGVSGGNSGGPIIDMDGCVVAQTTAGHKEDPSIMLPQRIDYALNAMDELSIVYRLADKSNLPLILWGVVGVLVVGFSVAIAVMVAKKRKYGNRSRDQRAGESKTKAVAGQHSEQLKVIGIAGTLAGKSYTLSSSLTFGRDPGQCRVVLANDVAGVSKLHCRLDVKAGNCTLTDLNSSCGTFLAGARLAANRPYPIQSGDSFSLGSDEVRFMLKE